MLNTGKLAPDFTCYDTTNNTFSLNNFKGKLLYIDFWATWCSPCRTEIPYYLKLQKDYKDKDISFISISIDDDKNTWIKFIRNVKSESKSLFNGGGWNSAPAVAYQIQSIPTFVLIDKEGKLLMPRLQGHHLSN